MRDRDAEFSRFVAARSPDLLRLAYLLSTDSSGAEDILQTALVRAYLRWDRISTNPEAYVRRIVATTVIDEHRRPFRRRETTLAERGLDKLRSAHADSAGAEKESTR